MAEDHVLLRLYVAGAAPNSQQALANLKRLCSEYLQDHFTLEVVDVFEEPERALADGVYLTPTLLFLSVTPSARILGNLNDSAPVLRMLGLS